MTRWEYAWMAFSAAGETWAPSRDASEFLAWLNKQGKSGWELIEFSDSVYESGLRGQARRWNCLMKRSTSA